MILFLKQTSLHESLKTIFLLEMGVLSLFDYLRLKPKSRLSNPQLFDFTVRVILSDDLFLTFF